MDMTIRVSSDVANLIPAVRREIRAIDGSLPIADITTAHSRLSERLGGRRFETQREIGIRSVLGADRQARRHKDLEDHDEF
jgi:hypothetical protein